jgi:hypothetical protein
MIIGDGLQHHFLPPLVARRERGNREGVLESSSSCQASVSSKDMTPAQVESCNNTRQNMGHYWNLR